MARRWSWRGSNGKCPEKLPSGAVPHGRLGTVTVISWPNERDVGVFQYQFSTRIRTAGALFAALVVAWSVNAWPAAWSQGSTAVGNARGLIDDWRFEEAEVAARKALTVTESESGADSLATAAAIDLLVEALWRGYGVLEPETLELAERAIEIKERALGTDAPGTAKSLSNLAHLLQRRGHYLDARPLHERVLAIRVSTLGADHIETADSLQDLGDLKLEMLDYEDAEELLRRALEIREQALGPDHPDVAESLNSLGLAVLNRSGRLQRYHYQGRPAAAGPLIERALEIREKQFGPDHPEVARSTLAVVSVEKVLAGWSVGVAPEQVEHLKSQLKTALDIVESRLGRHIETAIALAAEVWLDPQGRLDRLERSRLMVEETCGPDHPLLAAILMKRPG